MATAGASNYALDQLNDLLQDEVLNILQTYFELKIVQIEGGTLFFFLHNRLHELFHYFKKQPCCSTTPPCAAIKMKGTLSKDQFFLLFETDPSVQPTHEKKERGRITIHCICPLLPNRSTKILALDFTLINCLIKTSRQTPPAGNPQWITEIMDVRNLLSHKGDASTVTDQQIEEWWKRLEDAAINIAGTVGETYQEGVKRRIERMKKRQSEHTKMVEALNIKEILNALRNLGVQVGEVLFNIAKTEHLKEEPKNNSTTPVVSSTGKGEAPSKKAKTEFAAPLSTPNKGSKKCKVIWTFSSPGDWDREQMQKKLEELERLGDFDLQFVYGGSLIVHTLADINILSDKNGFKKSIEEFLYLFVNVLKIPKAHNVDITLSVWYPFLKDKNEEYSHQVETSKGLFKPEGQTNMPSTSKEDECRKKTVTELFEEDEQTSSTLTEEEDDSQKETVTETETQNTSALPSEDTSHAQAPVSKSQLPRELKKIKQINMSGVLIDCTAVDDTFVICDWDKKRLVVTDSDGSYIRGIPLSGMPYLVTTIDNTTVAVIIGNRDIDIINIYSGDRIRRISVDDYVRGLTYSEPHLYIGVEGKGIQVIDLYGNIIKTIPTERDALHMTINKQSIYYSDYNTLSCVKPSGERMWTVEDPMVKDIRGLTTDDTNIYVTCYSSHTVFVISPHGKQVRQLLTESDGLKTPQAICYNRKSNILMVCRQLGPAYLFNIVK